MTTNVRVAFSLKERHASSESVDGDLLDLAPSFRWRRPIIAEYSVVVRRTREAVEKLSHDFERRTSAFTSCVIHINYATSR